MRVSLIFPVLLLWCLQAAAQPGWKDCAKATTYRVQEDGNWQYKTGEIMLCYDTHAFTFKAGEKKWYTGITRYTQHLEDGYLVEEFYSEENSQYPESELRFRIVRGNPATVTAIRIPTGETWQLQSKDLPEIKVEERK